MKPHDELILDKDPRARQFMHLLTVFFTIYFIVLLTVVLWPIYRWLGGR